MSTLNDLQLPAKNNFISGLKGKPTALFYLKNSNSMQAALTNYGARMVSMLVPDKHGKLVDINVGFSSIENYFDAKDQCYGAVVGRYAGRIAKGQFLLDNKVIQLDINQRNYAIHGGNTGFQTRVWDASQINDRSVVFSYVSQDGEEGYPGKFSVKVFYELTDDDKLRIDFEYSTSKETVANIINHNFWNLNGEGTGSVNNHQLQIFTDQFNAVNEDCIPVEIRTVHNTPFDFLALHRMGERIEVIDEQLKYGNGYDHTYALKSGVSAEPTLAAIAIGDQSGIQMELYTTEPGVHFYTGNFMDGSHTFKCGVKDNSRTAFCLETQHFPNSPNRPQVPSTIKAPGKIYRSSTIHTFSIARPG